MKGVELANIKEVLAQAASYQQLAWLVGIHLTLVFSGVMFTLMNRISAGIHPVKDK